MEFDTLRTRMVKEQLIPRGICDERILDAFRKVPRHKFVPEELCYSAYADHPLPIGEGQTISQPYMVALMTESLGLNGTERVLEVGTGSGYQAAILAELAKEVYTIERIETIAMRAAATLKDLGYSNVKISVGDGTLGRPELSPFKAILVTAGSPKVPPRLVEQLADGGRLVVPVGGTFSQMLTLVEKEGKTTRQSGLCSCVFVPLVGKDGWDGR